MQIIDLAGIKHGVLVPAAALILALPAATYIDFVVRRVLSTVPIERPRKEWPARVNASLRLTGAAMTTPVDDETSTTSSHKSFLEETAKSFDAMLVCGSIGLAAWCALFVAADVPVAKQVSGLTMGFLFLGSAWLLLAPLIWRFQGRYLTTLGRDSAFRIGFSFIILALCSVVMDLRIQHTVVIPILIAYVIAIQELRHTFALIAMHRVCLPMSDKQRDLARILLAAVLAAELIGGVWILLCNDSEPQPGPSPPIHVDPPSSTPPTTTTEPQPPPPPPPPDPDPGPDPQPPLPPDPHSDRPKSAIP